MNYERGDLIMYAVRTKAQGTYRKKNQNVPRKSRALAKVCIAHEVSRDITKRMETVSKGLYESILNDLIRGYK